MIFLVQFGINKHLFCWSLKNLLVLIYSKLHSKSCDYLHKSWNDKGGIRRLREVNNISYWRMHLLQVSQMD